MNIEITTRKGTESGDTAWWSSHYRVIRSSRAKQGVTTFVSVRAGWKGRWIDHDSHEFIPENLSVVLEIGVPLKLRLLDLDPRLSLSRERGTGGRSSSSAPHFKERDPVTRFNLFRGIEACGRLILLASSLGNNMRICSTYAFSHVNRTEFEPETCLFQTFSTLELFKIIQFIIALYSYRDFWENWL